MRGVRLGMLGGWWACGACVAGLIAAEDAVPAPEPAPEPAPVPAASDPPAPPPPPPPVDESAARDAARAAYSAGAAHLQAGAWQQAVDQLDVAVAYYTGKGDPRVLRGIALLHLERFADAERDLTLAQQVGTRYMPRALYYLAAALAGQGRTQEAERCYAALLREHPASAEAEELRKRSRREQGPALASGEQQQAWLLGLGLGLGYDDNAGRSVSSASDGDADGSAVVQVDVALTSPRWWGLVELSLSAAHRAYTDVDGFDSSGVGLRMNCEQAEGRWQWSVGAGASAGWLDGDHESTSGGVDGSLSIDLGGALALRSSAAMGQTTFAQPGQSDFSGQSYAIGERLEWLGDRSGRLRRVRLGVGYQRSELNSSAESADDVDVGLSVGLRFTPLLLNLSASGGWRAYDEARPTDSEARSVRRVGCAAQAVWPLDENIWLLLGLEAQQHSSDADDEDYTRSAAMLSVYAEF